MQKMHVEYGFKGKARWRQGWNLLTTGKVKTFLTESDILSIWKQYSDYKRQEQLNSKPKA